MNKSVENKRSRRQSMSFSIITLKSKERSMKTSVKDFFDKFHIGTYYLQPNARTEAHVKELSECGIDLVFGMNNDKDTLDLFEKYGVNAVVAGIVPGWFGGHGDNAGTMSRTNKREAYVNGLSAFVDHPAIVGIDAGDEPSSLDFPYYGQMIELMKELAPSKFPYLNVYPSYGMLAVNDEAQIKKELGVSTYKEYVDSYGKNIDLPYLSFDHYVFTSAKERLFSDLNTTAEYCKNNGKKLYAVVQVNSREADTYVSEEQLCFQGFSALAYGASAVSWACYSAGWWHNQVLDADGGKTEQYEKLKKTNARLRAIAKEYINYRWISTDRINGTSIEYDAFKSISSDCDLLVGKFDGENGKKALFISGVDYENASNVVSFKAEGRKVTLYKPESTEVLTPDSNGIYTVSFTNSEACFAVAE